MDSKIMEILKPEWLLSNFGRKLDKEELKKRASETTKQEEKLLRDLKNAETVSESYSSESYKEKKVVKKPSKSEQKNIKLKKVAEIKELISISKPEFLTVENSFVTKKMKISLVYKDREGKSHNKTIFFGSKKRAYFIDHKIEKLREQSRKRRNMENVTILDGMFYEDRLLDGESTDLNENYMVLVKALL